MLTVDPHPLLDLRAFVTSFPRPLADVPSPPELQALLNLTVASPLRSDDVVREKVRHLLRHGGFKPTGRSKPASEYLMRAVASSQLASINPAVDACNLVSLHSGLPISVVDLERARQPFRVGVAPAGSNYIFNPSGQTIDVAGLLCLFDAEGPCANAVKDAQRTKTDGATRRTLSLIWGTVALPGRAEQTESWYRALLQQQGAETRGIPGPVRLLHLPGDLDRLCPCDPVVLTPCNPDGARPLTGAVHDHPLAVAAAVMGQEQPDRTRPGVDHGTGVASRIRTVVPHDLRLPPGLPPSRLRFSSTSMSPVSLALFLRTSQKARSVPFFVTISDGMR
jgi:DNA/RNA-binding domain of Phe-tRNA-synthetase-like protein